MNTTTAENADPFECVQPKQPLSRTAWTRKPTSMEEVRLGGWVEIFVGPDADPGQKELIVCGRVVWIDLAGKMVVMHVRDEVQDSAKTGIRNGDYIRVVLEEILASEFSREQVFNLAYRQWCDADEALLRNNGFYAANPRFDPMTPEWDAETAKDDGKAYYAEFAVARQEFLNRLAMMNASGGSCTPM